MLSHRHTWLLSFVLAIVSPGCSKPPTKPVEPTGLAGHSLFDRTEIELVNSAGFIDYVSPSTKPIPGVIFATESFDSPRYIFDSLRNCMSIDPERVLKPGVVVSPAEGRSILRSLKPMAGVPPPALNKVTASCAIGRVIEGKLEGFNL